MAVIVYPSDYAEAVTHDNGEKWVTDEDRNLVILGANKTAVAIYAHGDWSSAVTA